jgi:cardiolipin synthase
MCQRCSQLPTEHLGLDTADLDDRAALRLCRKLAEHNRRAAAEPDFAWQGVAFALSPSDYGK